MTSTETTIKTAEMPAGMVKVSKGEFFRRLMAEKRDIHPHSEKHSTDWMLVSTRVRWGWSSRGYCGPYDWQGAGSQVYALASA
jgi:hypothetical protein